MKIIACLYRYYQKNLRNGYRYCLILPVSVLLSVVGCSLDPHYERPVMPVPAKFPVVQGGDTGHAGDKQESVRSITWKEFFRSNDVQSVVQMALDNNRDLKIAILNAQAARAMYKVQRSDLIPSVDAQLQDVRQSVTQLMVDENPALASKLGQTVSQYSAGLAITGFEVDIFGHVRSKVRSAFESYMSEQAACRAVYVSLIAEVANAYVQWLADKKLLQLAQNILKTYEKSYNVVSAQYIHGIVPKTSFIDAKKMVDNARNDCAAYEKLLGCDRDALLQLIGKYEYDVLSPKYTLDNVSIMEKLPTALSSDILLLRPDIEQAEHRIRAANADVGQARALFFPEIDLTANYGFVSGALSSLFANNDIAFSVTPQISVPLLNNGRLLSNLEVSKIRKKIEATNYEKTVQGAFKEVLDGLVASEVLRRQLVIQHALVKESFEAHNMLYIKYISGLDSMLNALETEREMYIAQQNEVSVKAQFLTTMINMYKALGGGEDASLQCYVPAKMTHVTSN